MAGGLDAAENQAKIVGAIANKVGNVFAEEFGRAPQQGPVLPLAIRHSGSACDLWRTPGFYPPLFVRSGFRTDQPAAR